ncbi:hypothetical protein BV22DRAFT_1079330 [Leucogyrophana mollusca]|uniref:Uncharacterized protein n=1 Tax=Leucogyrophana mollusca TaxID=85980 RepID=A0ACB8BWQ0_9AGAM|nr:hypothetical protein BV22DRAFT_1079330 [Leucogyrophana mollusca]
MNMDDAPKSVAPAPDISLPLIMRQSKRAWSPSRPLPDSSDDEADDEQPPKQAPFDINIQYSSRAVDEPSILSTFQPTPEQNVFHLTNDEVHALGLEHTTTYVALVLAPGETLALLGVYTIVVALGAVSLLGINIAPAKTAHRIFAPRSAPVPIIRCEPPGPSTSTPISLPSRITSAPQRNADDAIILLRYLDTGVEGLGRVCRVFDGAFQPSQPRSRWARDAPPVPSLGIPGVHMVTHSAKDTQPFILPESWSTALEGACQADNTSFEPPTYLVKGPKKSGKSTFARTLLNRLLARYKRVAFIECDLGQSEFTPGGMVTLHIIDHPVFGPPFTHPSQPYRAHYIGSTAPRSNPSHYLAAVQALVETYRLEIQLPAEDAEDEDGRIPAIVNTMGWTKGLGADLNAKIEEFLSPTDIFEIVGMEEKGWPSAAPLPHLQSRSHDARRFELEGISPDAVSTHYNATDQRNLAILSYFHAVFPPSIPLDSPICQVTAQSWNTSLPLCARYPYEVDWSQAFDQIVLSGAGYEDVVPSEIGRVLNGAIVGLVECDEAAMAIDPQSEPSKIPYTQDQPPPPPATSTCHGLALIRGMSPSTPHMHILTPVPPPLLQRSRVLVKGELELPVWGMLDFRVGDDGEAGVAGVERARVPYLQWGKGEGLGSERRRIRRNLMRKGQM